MYIYYFNLHARSKRRSASTHSNLSEREQWIRSGRKRSRSRELNTRPKQRKFEEKKYEEKKKKSFLEEIREKLNEVRPTQVVQYSHPPMGFQPNSMPTPVPAPQNQYFAPQNPTGMPTQYDQNFFVGEGYHQRPTLLVADVVSKPIPYNPMAMMPVRINPNVQFAMPAQQQSPLLTVAIQQDTPKMVKPSPPAVDPQRDIDKVIGLVFCRFFFI